EQPPQVLRNERVARAQDEERWIYAIKQFIAGNLQALTVEEAQQAGKQSSSFEVDEHDLSYNVSWRSRDRPRGGTVQLRLVVPSTLHGEVLQHYHTSLQGAHQGVVRTYARVRKGAPRERGRSPGNIPATYPFQVLGMDHIPSTITCRQHRVVGVGRPAYRLCDHQGHQLKKRPDDRRSLRSGGVPALWSQ
ncbi:TPA: hypothetical protein N0F65_009248, partial [Lagenidium giganteum]